MKRQLAFVLGGGGARGALQIGALRALFENNIFPDLLIGTSIGAANAAFLAIHGVNLSSIEKLAVTWREAPAADLLPSNYLWLTVRALFQRPALHPTHRLREFMVAQGLSPDLTFEHLKGTRLYLVAADLNSGEPVIYGIHPQDSILEGVLASTALPPWVFPLEKDGKFLMDGGVVSNLPVEPALELGATEIIALDLADERSVPGDAHGFGPFLGKLLNTVDYRQLEMELKLAAARGVRVRHLRLKGTDPVQLWNFQYTDELMALGYQQTLEEIQKWKAEPRRGLLATARRWFVDRLSE